MSFSFVSSRGDYFSFHSLVSCRDSFLSLLARPPPFISPSLSFSRRFCSERFRRTFLFLSFVHATRVSSHWRASVSQRVIKLLFYECARVKDEQNERDLILLVLEREREKTDITDRFPTEHSRRLELICSQLILVTDADRLRGGTDLTFCCASDEIEVHNLGIE